MTPQTPEIGNQTAPQSKGLGVRVTIAQGDGIGPEIMDAVLFLMEQAGASLEIDSIEVGQKVYERGVTAGIEPSAWDSIRRTGALLKAPITTPRGKGYKSLNVTIRKSLGLFANVRPCPTFHPYIATPHPSMDVVIVRENEEDTYGGIEHRQTAEVTQCLKLITQPGTEKVVRYAFEYARAHGRKKVTCFVKDNIMKLTDGLFREVFETIAAEYPDIESNNMIVDIGSAKLAKDPGRFDVIVLPNLYGDIVSDIAAEISGSVGMCGSANIGERFAMFEAVHGSAPDIAGQGIANPSGLLHAAIQMLDHIGQPHVAQRLHHAWLCTIEDGVLTGDVAPAGERNRVVGTDAFAHAIANRLGRQPKHLKAQVHRSHNVIRSNSAKQIAKPRKVLVGVDVFVDWDQDNRNPNALASVLQSLELPNTKLTMITNRGTKVWPEGQPETFCTDHWRCRFMGALSNPIVHGDVVKLLNAIMLAGVDFIKTEHLYTFDGEAGYSRGQGE